MAAGQGMTSIQVDGGALDLAHAAAFKLPLGDAAALAAVTPEQVMGKVVFMVSSNAGGGRGQPFGNTGLLAKAALLVSVTTRPPTQRNVARLVDSSAAARTPMLTVADPAIYAALNAAEPGPLESTVSVHIAPSQSEP